jgi:hypothetical protein
MFARVTLLEIDAVRADIDAVLDAFRREIMPQVRDQPGYQGLFVLSTPEGAGLVMSLWTDEASLEATAPIASAAIERFMTAFRAPPGREHYDVRIADVPALALT